MPVEIYLYDEPAGDTSLDKVDSQHPFPVNVLNPVPATGAALTVIKNAQLTVSTTAVALSTVSGGIPAGAVGVQCFVESNGLRVTEDGVTTPTSSVGSPYVANATFAIWTTRNMGFAKFIRSGAADATLTMEFLGLVSTVS